MQSGLTSEKMPNQTQTKSKDSKDISKGKPSDNNKLMGGAQSQDIPVSVSTSQSSTKTWMTILFFRLDLYLSFLMAQIQILIKF